MTSVLGPVQPASISLTSSASPPTSWHQGPFGQSYSSHSHLMSLVLEPVQPAHLHPPHLCHPHTSWCQPFGHRISWLWYLGLSNQPPLHLTPPHLCHPHTNWCRPFGQSHLMASVLGPVQPASISPASSASPPTSWH